MATGGGLSHHPPPYLASFGKDALGHSTAGLLENRAATALPLQHLEIHPRHVVMDERDAFISWLRSEFAAANAIIDAMCHHLRVIGEPADYDFVLTCIQQRRLNWTVILHMQQFYSVAEVVYALQQVASRKQQARTADVSRMYQPPLVHRNVEVGHIPRNGSMNFGDSRIEPFPTYPVCDDSAARIAMSPGVGMAQDATSSRGRQSPILRTDVHLHGELHGVDSSKSSSDRVLSGPSPPPQTPDQRGELVAQQEIKKEGAGATSKSSGSILERISNIDMNAFSKEDEETRLSMVKVSKQFQCWEHVEGSMMNVVEGLEIYENVLSKAEASQLAFIVTQIHAAGKRGELGGQSFISENNSTGQIREIVQFGHAFFGNGHAGESLEPMPLVFSSLADRLIEWHILPPSRKPDCCCIDILEEGDCSPPPVYNRQLEPFLCSLCLLADCTMALGHKLSMKNGDCEGAFKVVFPQGSAVVLQGHSADSASQAVVASPGRRIIVTFSKMSGSKVSSASPAASKYAYLVPNSPPMTTAARPQGYGGVSSIRGPIPTVIKHYGIPTASGVLPIPPPTRPPPLHAPQPVAQHLSAANVQSLMTSPAGPTVRSHPGIGIINPGWAAIPRAPRPPNTGTGVFFPAGGSSSGSPSRPPGPQLQAGVALSPTPDTATFPFPSSKASRLSMASTEQSDQLAEKTSSLQSFNPASPNEPTVPRRSTTRNKELPPANVSPKSGDANGNRNTKDDHQQRSVHQSKGGVGSKSLN